MPDSTNDQLLAEIQQLKTRFTAQAEASATAQQQLRQEIHAMKKGLIQEAETPIIRDFLLFFDSLNWFQANLIQQELDPAAIEEHFQHLIDEMLEVLYRRNVVPQDHPTLFNKLKHHAVEVVKAEQPHHDFRVVRVLKVGFERNGETIRPSQVVVARYPQD